LPACLAGTSWLAPKADRVFYRFLYYHCVSLYRITNSWSWRTPQVYPPCSASAPHRVPPAPFRPHRLQVDLGITAVLTYLGTKARLHPHLPCSVTRALSPDGTWPRPTAQVPFSSFWRWPRASEAEFLARDGRMLEAGECVSCPIRVRARLPWPMRARWFSLLYAKTLGPYSSVPFGGRHSLRLLANYPPRVADSNRRIVALDELRPSVHLHLS